MNKKIQALKERLLELSHLNSALAILEWDMDVSMPERGMTARSETVSSLAAMFHERFLNLDHDGLLTDLKKDLDAKKLNPEEAVIASETWRSYDRERKLPVEFVKELAKITTTAREHWAEARAKADFSIFQSDLEKIFALKRKEAKLIGYTESPYDALLDIYEPGMTASRAEEILNDLKDFLVPFLAKIKQTKKAAPKIFPANKKFPLDQQVEFNRLLAQKIGFNFNSGVMAESVHPFTTGFHPDDVRFTTRYKESDPTYSIFSVVHEVGHGLYEQGLLAEHFGTPLGESVSHGIHESQSRLWENLVGRSLNFWKFFYPKLAKLFPDRLAQVSLEDFYRYINNVAPSLIRTEADEVTYNLHIIIRFEIEKELLEGSIAVKDLPKIWRDKVKTYLGIEVPNDGVGVLQDVHWSSGLVGYFPSYAFGNLYSAQFYHAAKEQLLGLDNEIRHGKFEPLLEWLRKNIHRHGKFYSSAGLVRAVTGEDLSSKFFIEYLKEKYGQLYQLKER